jgi:hypothetical protein
LYTLSEGGESLSVSWPYGPLPAPTVGGPTATYPNVLPGVNLLVSATPTGVSDVIEVTSAAAAANPRLAQIRFGVRASGLALSASASGGVLAANASGKAVFSAPPAQMWDSSGSAAQAGQVSDPGRLLPGDHAAVMTVRAAAGSLQLSPAASVLAGSSTVYPVWIDPTIGTVSPDSWLDVTKNCQNGTCSVPPGDWEPTATCPNGANCGIREGASCLPDNDGNCPSGTLYTVVRSYLNFSVPSQIWGAQYVHATLFTNETWVWSCQETTTVNLYQTNTADKGIDWNHQPTQLGLQDTSTAAYGNSAFGCDPHGVSFDASPALSDAARNKLSTVTLELRAPGADENDLIVNSWHRFSTSSKETYLTIDYRHAPDPATSPLTNGVFDPATDGTTTGCSQSATSPDWINTTTPTLRASFDDQDGSNGGSVSGEFSLAYSVPGGGGGDSGQSGWSDPPATLSWKVPSGDLTDGSTASWYAYGIASLAANEGTGNNLTGQSSATCNFAVDTNAPSPPAIDGGIYVSGTPSGALGEPGTFTFSDPANKDPIDQTNDVVGYKWAIDNPDPDNYVQAGSGHTAQVTITPFSGQHEEDLYVRAVDRAGNVSQGAATEFKIVANPPAGNIAMLGWWRLNAGPGGGNIATDATGHGNDATLSAVGLTCPGSPPGKSGAGYSCSLEGLGGGDAQTTRPVVGNDASFTVSVWVWLGETGITQIALSQAGDNVDGFGIGYQAGCNCWAFDMPASDSTSVTDYMAESPPNSATANVWTQLTGVFDASDGQMLLYVNGAQAGTAPANWPIATISPWSQPAGGVLRIASGGTVKGPVDEWGGFLSDACVFYGPLSTTSVQTLHTSGCAGLST